MLRVGVIGYGYWGPNLARNFAEFAGSEVVAVSDLRPQRLAIAQKRYPTAETTADFTALIANPRVDAVAIATPVSCHFELAWEALQAGKHVLVEKPLAASREQALRLVEEADKRRLVLMVDHTFAFTGAVRKIRELVSEGQLGQVYYYDSVRINLGLFQSDVNVMWDLAVHDLSILDCVVPDRPCAVSATGVSHVPGEPENIAYLTLFFEGGFIAHIHVNWLAPVKIRRTLIGGSKKMILYDDVEPSEKVKVYDKGILVNSDRESMYQMLIQYRAGDLWVPQLDITEALRAEAEEFTRCVAFGKTPLSDGRSGLRVVEVLEAATCSMKDRGRPVEIRMEAS